MTNFTMTNSFARKNTYGLGYNAVGEGTIGLNAMAPGPTWTFLNNILGGTTGATYPATTGEPTAAAMVAAWTDPASGSNDDNVNYTVKAGSIYKAGGASQASDGADIGVNMCNGVFPDPVGLTFQFLCPSPPIRLRRVN